jgi:hypothetical protein
VPPAPVFITTPIRSASESSTTMPASASASVATASANCVKRSSRLADF